MNELTLPSSPNWYLSNILACARDGTIAWGSRHSIVIAKANEETNLLDCSSIDKAHLDRVTSVAFSPNKIGEDDEYRLVSSGDENTVKVWKVKDLLLEKSNYSLDSNRKVIGVDWSKCNQDLICFVSEDGTLVRWNYKNNASKPISLGKMTATCLSCCPNDFHTVAVGSKSGLIYIVNIQSATVTYKLRGHDVEVVSLSWCPVPINIFKDNNEKEALLASGAKDRHIFLWRAGGDGRYQTQLTFPNAPLDTNNHRSKVSASAGNYTAVCWLEPTTLLTSSPWGELLAWDISGDPKKKFTPKLVHANHRKGLFSVTGFTEFSAELFLDSNSQNWRNKTDIKRIWTVGQDRHVICSNLINNEVTIDYNIPTQGGFVYCMAACPLDTSQIAFGVGDAMIRLWNLSEPHKNSIEVQMLWEKIKGKVRALSWHPEKENLLAFATDEGRIGIFDTNSKKAPILCRQYYRHTVYSVGWGPAPKINGHALYSCGDNEVVYYNPDKYNENPISVTKKKDCTEFAWKPDFSLLALGFADGSISFLNPDLSECGHTIHVLNKSVQCLVWHPESTSSDTNISALNNYLAVAINGTPITIFEILNKNNSEENKSDESSFYRIVATLDAHHDKVVTLAWSPHVSGYLVSGAYDYNIQVWNVESQEIIGTYVSHKGPVMSCMWSPLSQDFIISGSGDFTLRIWNITNQEKLSNPPMNLKIKGKRTKKKKNKKLLDTSSEKENETGIKVLTNDEVESPEDSRKNKVKEENHSEETEDTSKIDQNLIKKKVKKISRFPGHANIVKNNKRWCTSVKNLLQVVQNETQNKQINEIEPCNGNSNEINGIENGEIGNGNGMEDDPILLGTKEHLHHAINYEKNKLRSSEMHSLVTEIDFWTGNLKENLQEAVKHNRLSDYLVALAPSISVELWKEMCEAYAIQLSDDDNPHKAVSYFLCINKITEAIEVFITARLFKEAYVLASSKLDENDSLITDILQLWASSAQKDGDYQNAIACYIKLREYAKAAKLLEKRGDIDSLHLAIDIAHTVVKDEDLSISLVDKLIYEALLNSDISSALSIIKKYPEMQHREIEATIFYELSKVLEKVNNNTIVKWFDSKTEINLLELMKQRFLPNPKEYSFLVQKDVIPLPKWTSEKIVQINVSHELALSTLTDDSKTKLKHILKAFDIIVQFDRKNQFALLLKYISILENKTFEDSNNIFNTDENGMSKSLRAYLCYAVIDWFHRNELNDYHFTVSVSSLILIIEKYANDLLSRELVQFYCGGNALKEIEAEIYAGVDINKPVKEEDSIVHYVKYNRFSELEVNKKEFIETRVASPSPLYALPVLLQVLYRIRDEEVRIKIGKFVADLWKKATV